MFDLSVVIPVYNGEALLKRCLDSVCAQKTQYQWEIIVVDDGSTDRSTEIVESYVNENDLRPKAARTEGGNLNPNSNIRLLKQQNGGPAKARNWGMKEAQGRYITLLDADDYWMDEYIEKSVSFLDKHPDCVAVNVVCKNVSVSGVSYTPEGFNNENDNDNENHLRPKDVRTEGNNENADSNSNEKRRIKKYNKKNIVLHNKISNAPFILDDFYAYWAEMCHVGTCSTTIKSQVAKSVLMREDLRISEDYEFWLCIAAFGKWGLIPEPLYVSDGTDAIVDQQSWLDKMARRWANAPALSVWESRILELRPDLKGNEYFRRAEGRVSRNLTYCQLLSGRRDLARQEALEYGNYFVPDSIGRLMNLCKHSAILWSLLCKFLQYREYHRFG